MIMVSPLAAPMAGREEAQCRMGAPPGSPRETKSDLGVAAHPAPRAPAREGVAMKGPEPCVGCRFAARCRADKLACDALAVWASGAGELRWRAAPRAPTRARFEALVEVEQRKARELAAA